MLARERVHSQEPARRLFPASVGLMHLVGKSLEFITLTSHASGRALRACECGSGLPKASFLGDSALIGCR